MHHPNSKSTQRSLFVLVAVFAVFSLVVMEAQVAAAAAAPFKAPVVKPGDTIGFISPGTLPLPRAALLCRTLPSHLSRELMKRGGGVRND
jgi:hypothetical protein